MKKAIFLLVLLLACLPGAVFAADDAGEDGGETLKVPRFVSLKEDKVFVRTGPSPNYPIRWVYTRPGLPVEITQEYDAWRRIRDRDGGSGWVHKILLSGRRTAIVAAAENVMALQKPVLEAAPAMTLEAGAVVHLTSCGESWCEIRAQGFKGWVPRDRLWGIYPEERFE